VTKEFAADTDEDDTIAPVFILTNARASDSDMIGGDSDDTTDCIIANAEPVPAVDVTDSKLATISGNTPLL
jgi:hypothetical protein